MRFLQNKTLIAWVMVLLVAGCVYLIYSSIGSQGVVQTDQSGQEAITTDTQAIMDAIKRVESEQPPRIGQSPTAAEIYASPYIQHIRPALNGYLDGSNAGAEEAAMDITSDSSCGLGNFDKSYYQSKFIILEASDNDYGGVQAYIVFVNKPDSIFWAWVYQLGGEGGKYVLRAFCKSGPPADQTAQFKNYINEIISSAPVMM
ncbi:MAG: hypothetical protein EXS69_02615 [Candidatus Zambryskibacteria bacterium]|nr:hypothetical protein [Candidatus Zambryskibacteria bacterium]